MTFRLFRRAAAPVLSLVLLVAVPVAAARAVTIDRVVSPGGIEAWLVQDPTLPVVSLEAAFRGGAATDPADKPGLATMTASLLDEGAGPLDSQAFQRRIEDLATGVRFRASQDNLSAGIRTLKGNLGEALGLLRLSLTEPRFDEAPVARIRSELAVSLARKAESPNSIADRMWRENALGQHPYARQSEGTPQAIERIATNDMREFVRQRLARDVLTIGVVGDVTPAELGPLLDATFGALPARAEGAGVPDARIGNGGAVLLSRMPIPQTVVEFGQAGIKRDDPDWYAALIVNHILGGGGFTSRLTNEVREKRGLAYSVYSYLAPYRHVGLILGGVATENARVAQSIEIIRGEWRRMRDEGPTEDELRNAKTYLTGSFPLQFDSTARIAATLVDIQQEKLGIDYLDKRNAYIEAVTLAEAKRVAKRLLDPDALTFSIVGNPANVTPTREVPPKGDGRS